MITGESILKITQTTLQKNLLALAISLSFSAHAEITRLEIDSTEPYGTFRSGEYVLIKGKLRGEISPKENIPGLDQIKTNSRGNIEYATKLVLIMPSEKGHSNGALLVDVPNRGRAYAQALYNSPRDEPFQSGSFEQGTGFLQDYGYSVAEVYWELGQGAELPSFTDKDGKTRFAEGVGFAIMRDAGIFFSKAAADATGNPNPLKGQISRTIASGKSQTGRFLKTFLLNGFNMAGDRRVFDGMQIFVSGSGLLPILQTGTGPESSGNASPNFTNPEMRGVHEKQLTIGDITQEVQARGEVPPKMLLLSTSTDFYSLRASLGRTGASGTTDQPIPANVRMYDLAGASHVLVPKQPKDCTMPRAVLDWTPVSRATFLRLDEWVTTNSLPPQSRLMVLEKASDKIPTLPAPAHLPNAVIQVPQLDTDGNAVGGVRLPDLVAPLGTHGGQNAPQTFTCSLIGSYSAFAVNKEEREKNKDQRPSLTERYQSRDQYVGQIRQASANLMHEGFLLQDDAAVIIQAAASTPLFVNTNPNPNPR